VAFDYFAGYYAVVQYSIVRYYTVLLKVVYHTLL